MVPWVVRASVAPVHGTLEIVGVPISDNSIRNGSIGAQWTGSVGLALIVPMILSTCREGTQIAGWPHWSLAWAVDSMCSEGQVVGRKAVRGWSQCVGQG